MLPIPQLPLLQGPRERHFASAGISDLGTYGQFLQAMDVATRAVADVKSHRPRSHSPADGTVSEWDLAKLADVKALREGRPPIHLAELLDNENYRYGAATAAVNLAFAFQREYREDTALFARFRAEALEAGQRIGKRWADRVQAAWDAQSQGKPRSAVLAKWEEAEALAVESAPSFAVANWASGNPWREPQPGFQPSADPGVLGTALAVKLSLGLVEGKFMVTPQLRFPRNFDIKQFVK